jgi:hypothetical protein
LTLISRLKLYALFIKVENEAALAFQCCQDIGVLSTTFETAIELDPCNFILRIRIEKLTFEIRFHDFSWGKY